MSTRPRFGVQFLQQHSWPDVLAHFEDLETTGFDSAFLADHFANPFGRTDWLECWTLLAALANATQRIRIGSLISSPIYRHPAVIAQHALTVDHISGGRLEVGLGAGGSPFDHSMTGVPMWSLRERVDRLGEFVTVVDQMLRQEVTTYKGEYYEVAEALMLTKPLQRPRPRLLVAADGPRSVRIAARHADAWVACEMEFMEGQVRTLEETRALTDRFSQYVSEAGRDPESIDRWLLCGFAERTAFESIQAMHDLIGSYQELGFNGFLFNYVPGSPEKMPAPPGMITHYQFLTSPDRLHELAEALKLSA